MHFRLQEPLNDATLAKLSDASVIYGIQKVELGTGTLMVEYDASRMRPAEVESALAQAGVDAERT
jgi:allophanate hydrolase subunit 1